MLNNPLIYVDPSGHASYLVSWSNVGGSKKGVGITHISGQVISLDNNSNGNHNAVSFKGTFGGFSFGLPFGGSYSSSQIFNDSEEIADVTRIEGYSSFSVITSSLFGTGGISWGLYAFGDLYFASDEFSDIEGYELTLSIMLGWIDLEGEVVEVTPGYVNELLESTDLPDNNSE